jgi:pre-mRNA-splicing factor ATP-dependent RNA helicase DHX15/PRP43
MERVKKIVKTKNKFQNPIEKKENGESESALKINPLTYLPFSKKYFEILEEREKLPAYKGKEKFLELIQEHDIVIIEGETGSGKTTQIPQFLLSLNL